MNCQAISLSVNVLRSVANVLRPVQQSVFRWCGGLVGDADNLRRGCRGSLPALCRATDAQDDSDIDAVDNRRRAALAQQRQWLSRHRCQTNRNPHVHHGLHDEQQGQSHRKEGWEAVLATGCDVARAEQQDDIEQGNDDGAEDAQFLNDNGVDEVGERL